MRAVHSCNSWFDFETPAEENKCSCALGAEITKICRKGTSVFPMTVREARIRSPRQNYHNRWDVALVLRPRDETAVLCVEEKFIPIPTEGHGQPVRKKVHVYHVYRQRRPGDECRLLIHFSLLFLLTNGHKYQQNIKRN